MRGSSTCGYQTRVEPPQAPVKTEFTSYHVYSLAYKQYLNLCSEYDKALRAPYQVSTRKRKPVATPFGKMSMKSKSVEPNAAERSPPVTPVTSGAGKAPATDDDKPLSHPVVSTTPFGVVAINQADKKAPKSEAARPSGPVNDSSIKAKPENKETSSDVSLGFGLAKNDIMIVLLNAGLTPREAAAVWNVDAQLRLGHPLYVKVLLSRIQKWPDADKYKAKWDKLLKSTV